MRPRCASGGKVAHPPGRHRHGIRRADGAVEAERTRERALRRVHGRARLSPPVAAMRGLRVSRLIATLRCQPGGVVRVTRRLPWVGVLAFGTPSCASLRTRPASARTRAGRRARGRPAPGHPSLAPGGSFSPPPCGPPRRRCEHGQSRDRSWRRPTNRRETRFRSLRPPSDPLPLVDSTSP